MQAPVPEQFPDHPAKVAPEKGVGVNVTDEPATKEAEQAVFGQLMPAGLLVILPPELLVLDTLSGKVKVAVTLCAKFIVTLHVPVPEQPPLQPINVPPASGVAVSVTMAPGL